MSPKRTRRTPSRLTSPQREHRPWIAHAIGVIQADFQRSSDTHLIPLTLPGFEGIDFYLKDESSHPTGSLKHRLARSLFLHALCNGWLHHDSVIVEASSGSTAISEAYFARLLNLRFVAVMPRQTSRQKIEAIEFQGGHCHLVDDPKDIYATSLRLAREHNGHYMDQFTYAERATDWRANNNIAESIFEQLKKERHPQPAWIVAGAGTGGTLATTGRYVRYCQHHTKVCGADPEFSVFFEHFLNASTLPEIEHASRIEGIGRPRVEASFLPAVLDAMVKVPDVWSLGATHALSSFLGRRVGGSTGTNLIAALLCGSHMKQRGETGSIVTLLCDDGNRYAQTYFDEGWLAHKKLSCAAEAGAIAAMMRSGRWPKALRDAVQQHGL
jgi:cysteine synthase